MPIDGVILKCPIGLVSKGTWATDPGQMALMPGPMTSAATKENIPGGIDEILGNISYWVYPVVLFSQLLFLSNCLSLREWSAGNTTRFAGLAHGTSRG
ncbi:hypothetical protein UVI_02026560 [Ustilaginoidea virens]|uniref:Uncharacterized protein n=1 Tax=Ustilaginoidea virens TaxID=1159556 RepID=A0A1B5L3X8_USTVR|nr:hypothetical protein UVI_02026560 [Ustilaginoidea virens]